MLLFCISILFSVWCRPQREYSAMTERKMHLTKVLPVVFWHGMGDNGRSTGIEELMEIIRNTYPGIYVKSLHFGGHVTDIISGYYPDGNTLVAKALKDIESDENLKYGYIGIGLSQGAQLLRAVAQRHSKPLMSKLISIGGQHQGVFGIPNCDPIGLFCQNVASYASKLLYTDNFQHFSLQAGYWHDPFQPHVYAENSLFLGDINQERRINESYRNNIRNLSAFIMVKFTQDSIVFPKESSHFGFYDNSDLTKTVAMEDSDLYKEDRLGLRYLNQKGKIKFLEVENNHLRFTTQWFQENIVPVISTSYGI